MAIRDSINVLGLTTYIYCMEEDYIEHLLETLARLVVSKRTLIVSQWWIENFLRGGSDNYYSAMRVKRHAKTTLATMFTFCHNHIHLRSV